MAISHQEVHQILSGPEASAKPALESQSVVEVRSTVESHFREMEQVHDRIRTEELTARLATEIIYPDGINTVYRRE